MRLITALSFFILLFFTEIAVANPDKKIAELGLNLSEKGEPTATFVYSVQTGNLLFTAGHVSVTPEGKVIKGKLGKDLTTEQGAEAARMAGVSLLATIKQNLGSLSRVKRLVKVTGMVNSTPDFTQHSQVINGFSDLMVEVFGDNGQHARSAVGMNSLPLNSAVEIEIILEIKE
ncbi:RidA family protein [Alteromonas ponticola]|uniref:RidA family protein n=1 Tax=Alteromonas ponticola TaxID=2720613 RepID=A0ABX1R7S6_9ALTE|nr:RidA family protein [Alteromonas ponticola]NMH61177.1 RidA family protein [Alteromonas ponticola]